MKCSYHISQTKGGHKNRDIVNILPTLNTSLRLAAYIGRTAITSRVHTKAKLPTHTAVSDYEGLDKDSVILLEQIRTIDKQRLKQYMGMMPDNIMARVDKALAISVALEKNMKTNV